MGSIGCGPFVGSSSSLLQINTLLQGQDIGRYISISYHMIFYAINDKFELR